MNSKVHTDFNVIKENFVPRYTVVTSFNAHMWQLFVRNNFSSWITFLPDSVNIIVWYEGPKHPEWVHYEKLGNVEFKSLMEHGSWIWFIEKYKRQPVPQVEPGHQFRFTFLPFWHKVFALTTTCHNVFGIPGDADVVVWLDADVSVKQPVTIEHFEDWLKDKEIAWLARSHPWYTPDTGFIILSNTDTVYAFLNDLRDAYLSGMIFDFREWHDAAIFGYLMKLWSHRGLEHRNLTYKLSAMHPFEHSEISEYFEHQKGPRKFDPQYDTRIQKNMDTIGFIDN